MELTSIYLSRILGNKIFISDKNYIGTLMDVTVSLETTNPKVILAKVKTRDGVKYFDWNNISIKKQKGQYILTCSDPVEKPFDGSLLLKKYVFDKQIIDVNGRKVVRVNDVRLGIVSTGLFVLAVDIGMEGVLRRIGIARPLVKLGLKLPSRLMLWNDVQAISSTNDIRLSKVYDRLSTLHPSDLADIIEDFDINTGMIIFSSLDAVKAADVLEELEEDVQEDIISSLSPDKAANILREMPADEIADILDGLDEEHAEKLLNSMEYQTSSEVRGLMEYDEELIGSLMMTDFVTYRTGSRVHEVLSDLRNLKPEHDQINTIYVITNELKLSGMVSLRDLVISGPEQTLGEIMNKDFIFMYDTDKIEDVIEATYKYHLYNVPVLDKDNNLVGSVSINDIVFELLKNDKRVG